MANVDFVSRIKNQIVHFQVTYILFNEKSGELGDACGVKRPCLVPLRCIDGKCRCLPGRKLMEFSNPFGTKTKICVDKCNY